MSYEWIKVTRPDLELTTVRNLRRGGRLEYSGSGAEKKVPSRHNREPGMTCQKIVQLVRATTSCEKGKVTLLVWVQYLI